MAKLTFICLFCMSMVVSAKSYTQEKVSLKLENASLDKSIRQLQKKSHVRILYSEDLLNKALRVSINWEDTPLLEALSQLLFGTGLDVKVIDSAQVAIMPYPALQYYKTDIQGTVVDENGKPIEGVTVLEKGTNNGATTDSAGAFKLKVKDNNAVLIISRIGFATEERLVGDATDLHIALKTAAGDLNEVVVVGYGKQDRASLTSSISTIKGENLNKGAISDIGQLLQGKVPGLNITSNGNPNKTAAVILRGASTLNSSQSPFYVIDGFPGADISTLAPDDIASVEVLKDAAATAIYGNRAANGVIMVTTKKGKNGRFQFSYSGYAGIEKISNNLHVMDADQLTSFMTKNNLSLSPSDDKGANTNWQKEIERSSAFSHNHNISLSGGGEHGSYTASVNYLKKEGIIKHSDLERVIGRLAIEHRVLNDKVKFNLTVTNTHSNSNDVPYLNTVLLQAAHYLPVSPVKNDDGSWFENLGNTNYYNPVAMMDNSQANTKYNVLVGNFSTEVQLPFNLKYNLNLGYQNTTSLYGDYYNSYYTSTYNNMYDNPDPSLGYHSNQTFGTNGQATRSSYQNITKLLENYLTWNKSYGMHHINAVLGYSWQNFNNGDGFAVTTSNFPIDNIAYNNLALSNPYAYSSYRIGLGSDGTYQQIKLISDFARLNYDFQGKYLLQASLRRDGSSVFGKDHQWGYFPSIGVAWRVIKERFMENQSFFDDLKFRASYGVTGNSTGFNAYTAQLISGSKGTYYNNGVLTAAYGSLQADNPDLKWEKTGMANIGFDFVIMKGALSGTVDWYNKKTTGMIYSYNADPIKIPTGSITANGGSMKNTGIELTLNADIVNKKEFSWTSSLNLAHNNNKIVSLTNPLFTGGDSIPASYPEGGGQSGSSLQLLKEGKPLGQFFSLEYAGKNADGVSQYVAADGSLTTSPSIGTDYHYLGNAQPKLLAGWGNNFRYKNFQLNFFFRGTFGNKIFNATRADLFRPSTAQYGNILVDAGSESVSDYNAYKYSSRFIESGTYVRLDNTTLAYNFHHLGNYVKSLRIYLTANNVFVITGYKGVDPEINQGGIAPGVDYNNFYPKTRTLLFGVNVGL